MDKFDNLSSESGLKVNEIDNFDFVKKYGQNYFEKDEIKEFLACVFGFLLTDGHIKKNKQLIQFYFRYENDALLFKETFEKYFPEEKLFIEYARSCYRVSLFNVHFANLMNHFGVPIGNKVFQSFKVPDWIYCGNDCLKRAFLSSLFGGEGSAPSNNKWRIQFVISKCKKEVPNLIFFINQVRHMLFHLGISSSHIQLRKQNDSRQFHARFYVKGKVSLLKFYELIGFSYASEKQLVLNDLLRRHSYIN